MKKLIYIIFAITAFAGCITNDIPYPVVEPKVISADIEGAEKVEVDNTLRLITAHIAEYVDMRNVNVKSIDVDTEIAELSSGVIGSHDLSQPCRFSIRTYDDYKWTLAAEKHVERYFTVEGQIGSSVIDEHNCRAIAVVGKKTDISAVNVTSLKLGPEGLSDYSVSMSEMKDFTHGLSVDVTAFGETESWMLFVEVTEVNVDIKKINPWACEAYITAAGVAGNDNGFNYREAGASDWLIVDEADIVSEGGTFVAHLRGLNPETDYEIVAYSGSEMTSVFEFTTESAVPVPNGSFEYASKVKGKDYYKFYDPSCGVKDGEYMFWGSGNGEGTEGVSGSANMGIVITYIDTEDKVDGRQSVRAQTSQMAGILAAGNLFTGQFAGLVGTSGGMVNFGRPWSSRPVAMKLYCKYVTGKMDIIKGAPAGMTLTKEDYDRAEIKFALGDWDYRKYGGTKENPVHVNTTDSRTFVDFNTDASTIANGGLIIHHDGYILNGGSKVSAATDQWVEYTIPLEYRDIERRPTHIIISCAASQFGDYFTGYSSSKLWIDAVELIY
ncbi:MAG: PCMD domain-containing protein [Bacteroidales bacterium]|nr:PCMD domain-containing protein [Bacteroidales bacterium]